MDFSLLGAFFWLTLPNFLIILIVTCVDRYAYRKLDTSPTTGKRVLLTLLTIAVAHLLFIVTETLLISLDSAFLFCPLVLIPLVSILALFVLSIWERKSLPAPASMLSKKLFADNRVLTLLFDLFYGLLIYQWFFPIEFEILGTAANRKEPQEVLQDTVLVVGTVLLIATLTVIKIFMQKKADHALKKETESEP